MTQQDASDAAPDRNTAGRVIHLEPGVRRILAPNPSPLTGAGTNSYLVGQGRVALIDPGPDDPAHLEALLAALEPGEVIETIVVTHAHHDHSALAPRLAARVAAPVVAFGTALDGRNPALAALPQLGGGEGLDLAFRPDVLVADGASISGPDWTLDVVHTPGHLGNHISLRFGDALFSGDVAMGWATSIVSPPDGDMTAYMASLERLVALAPTVLYPGHGPAVADGVGRLTELITHRRQRESQILAALAAGSGRADELAARVYTDVAAYLLPAATRNVLAHLIDMHGKNTARTESGIAADAIWSRL